MDEHPHLVYNRLLFWEHMDIVLNLVPEYPQAKLILHTPWTEATHAREPYGALPHTGLPLLLLTLP